MIIFVTLLLATWMTRAGLGKETIDRCEFLLMHRFAVRYGVLWLC